MPNLPVESSPLPPSDKSKPIYLRVTCQPPNPWQPACVSTRWSAQSEPPPRRESFLVVPTTRRIRICRCLSWSSPETKTGWLRLPGWEKELADQIPGSELRVVNGTGHCPHIEHPDETNGIILDFLRRIDGEVAWYYSWCAAEYFA